MPDIDIPAIRGKARLDLSPSPKVVIVLCNELEALRKANIAFLRAWHKAGPDGSAQWEKFDVALRLARIAEEPMQ